MRQISPYLVWLGHAGDGRAFRELFELGIRAVVQLAAEEPTILTPRELIYFRFPLLDGTGNDPQLLDIAIRSVSALMKNGIPSLVCCGAGMSRSPSIVAAALSVHWALDFEECLKFVTGHGPADLSPGLIAEMKQVIGKPTQDD